ncbi:reverse transcriptase domain-containing protein, partial [Tanacetum coccineum]
AMIDQGVIAILAARDANTNGVDSRNSGTGVVELTQWIEKMETVFRISNCSVENKIKFSTYTLLGNALTWWNSHVRTVGNDIAYEMTWTEPKKKITDKYCQRTEIKKLEVELWELKVKGTDVIGYNQCFKELELLCGRMFPEESDTRIKENMSVAYPNYPRSSVKSEKCRIRESAPLLTARQRVKGSLMTSQGILKTNHNITKGRTLAKPTLHDLCNKFGHLARDCRSSTSVNPSSNQRGNGTGQGPTCFECGVRGHFKKDYPKLKKNNNNNRGNQVGNANAPAKVYAVGHAGINPNSNVVTGTFLLNNRYASILFDTGTNRSFVSNAFSSQIDITPSTLDHHYNVELVDGRIIGLNTILRGCTLNLLNHPFNINLMPIELGSFDTIIGMDWLAKYQAIIVCAEKIVRIP